MTHQSQRTNILKAPSIRFDIFEVDLQNCLIIFFEWCLKSLKFNDGHMCSLKCIKSCLCTPYTGTSTATSHWNAKIMFLKNYEKMDRGKTSEINLLIELFDMMLTFLVASLIKREHAGYRPFDEEWLGWHDCSIFEPLPIWRCFLFPNKLLMH